MGRSLASLRTGAAAAAAHRWRGGGGPVGRDEQRERRAAKVRRGQATCSRWHARQWTRDPETRPANARTPHCDPMTISAPCGWSGCSISRVSTVSVAQQPETWSQSGSKTRPPMCLLTPQPPTRIGKGREKSSRPSKACLRSKALARVHRALGVIRELRSSALVDGRRRCRW